MTVKMAGGHGNGPTQHELQSRDVMKMMQQLRDAERKVELERKRNAELSEHLVACQATLTASTGEDALARCSRQSSAIKVVKEENESLREEIRTTSRRLIGEERQVKGLEADVRMLTNENKKLTEELEEANLEIGRLRGQSSEVGNVGRFGSAKGSDLREAARSNDVSTITRLLKGGADPNQDEDSEGRTPIFWAAQCGAVESINALAENGADVRRRARADAKAWRWRLDDPLTTACQCGQPDACRALLVASACPDIDASCEYQQADDQWYKCTPLLAACVAGQAEVVKILIEFGADLAVTRDDGGGPLHCAVRADHGAGHIEAVRFLIEKKANLDAKDHDSWTPLLHAITLRCMKCVRVLLAMGASLDVALEGQAYTRNLVDAVMNDDVGLIFALLESGTDANLPKVEPDAVAHQAAGLVSFTPLCAAVRHRRGACVAMFLEAQADPNQRSIAYQPGQEEIHSTPLMLAAQNGDEGIIKTLITYAANVNFEAQPQSGFTPLHAAVEASQQAAAKLLKDAGAVTDIVATRAGVTLGTALDMARDDHPEIYVLLK